MSTPLLETKYRIPRPRRGALGRPRLGERLDRTWDATLALVSAPAGFGKTTLLAEWLATTDMEGRAAAWVSLDPRDNDPAVFWAYVAAAVDAAVPGTGVAARTLLSDGAPMEGVVTALLNDLAALADDLVLVLDDFHVVEAQAVRETTAFLVEHLPRQVHLVLATRADPSLPLATMRARGELLEVRAADLRFTPAEAAAYLNDAMDLALTAEDVATLERRTEGWIAALQLAALSMQGRDDVPGFIAGFAGDDRYILDYLVGEVLARQPDEVRAFLLDTSILVRLSGPLCDAVTGRDDSAEVLERLDRSNLFMVALDDRRHWYRYHHLFAEVLRAHLATADATAVAERHRRASAWYAAADEPSEAIRHSLAAGDDARAAELVEAALPGWSRNRQEATMRRQLQALPDAVVRARPVLSVGLVGSLAAIGEFHDDSLERLDEAERLLKLAAAGTPAPGADGPDQRAFRSLPGAIEMYRAALALNRGDRHGTRVHGGRALDAALDDDHLLRGAAAALVGLAAWADGDVAAAIAGYEQSIDALRRAGHLADILGCSITLADLHLEQGRLREAMRTYRDGLALGTGQGGPPLRGTADMHVGLSELLRERGDLDAAAEHLERSAALGEANGLPQHPYRSRLALARLHLARGEAEAAWPLLDEAERVYRTDFSPSVRPIPAVRAGLQADHGALALAAAWARDRGLDPLGTLDYLEEFELLTLARVLVAQSRPSRSDHAARDAVDLLRRLLDAAERGGRGGTALQTLVLLARAEDARGDRPAALAHLAEALERAEPEGYVRLFLDERPAIDPLLEALARGPAAGLVGRLLGAASPRPARASSTERLVDPLSDRELDVLRLLATDLSGPEIARELTVSLNTMRTHSKNIYAKLGVTSRRAAVSRAAELQLLSARPL